MSRFAAGAVLDPGIFLTAKERRIWEKMPEHRKRLIVARVTRTATKKNESIPDRKGEVLHEADSQYVHAGISGQKEFRKGEVFPYKGASRTQEVGRGKRQDPESTVAPAEADSAVGTDDPQAPPDRKSVV